MKIVYSKDYIKAFQKLPPKKQDKVERTISIFQNNPYDSSLKNHPLHGALKGFYAISAGGDLRLLFKEYDNYKKVIFVLVGTHNQVY